MILTLLAEEESLLSQRQIEEKISYSLGTVNRVMKALTELKYVNEGKITNEGLTTLEPYRAKRAIFIEAGFGSRLVPITFNTPKLLVRVHGVRIIDRLIDACGGAFLYRILYLLIVWIALGAVFIFGKNNFSRAKNKVFVLSSPHMDY